MPPLSKVLVLTGLFLVAAGFAVWAFSRTGFRGLPGDIRYEGENFRFYFPIVTCLALSAVLTLILWLWRWWNK